MPHRDGTCCPDLVCDMENKRKKYSKVLEKSSKKTTYKKKKISLVNILFVITSKSDSKQSFN